MARSAFKVLRGQRKKRCVLSWDGDQSTVLWHGSDAAEPFENAQDASSGRKPGSAEAQKNINLRLWIKSGANHPSTIAHISWSIRNVADSAQCTGSEVKYETLLRLLTGCANFLKACRRRPRHRHIRSGTGTQCRS